MAKKSLKDATSNSKYGQRKKNRKNKKRRVAHGQAHIKCSYNNTMIALSDLNGSILGWSSSGSMGFKGAKKATPYAATIVTNKVVESVAKVGLREVDVYVKGVGAGREAAIRALGNNGLKVNLIKDVTPVPHNGVRAKKPRRV
jgi:small subunit ribosomal protein S11